MRSDILNRIQVLLQNEDLEAIRKDVRSAIEDFRAMNHEDVRNQRDAWSAREDREPEEVFEYVPAPEQEAFEAAVAQFKEREKSWRHKIAALTPANSRLRTLACTMRCCSRSGSPVTWMR